MKRTLSLMIAVFLMIAAAKAQDATQLMTEFKSSTRAENIKSLNEAKDALQGSGIQSLDKMAERSSELLASLQTIGDTIPSVYERVFNETMEGLNNDDLQKPTVEELEGLAAEIANSATAIATASSDLESVSNDVVKIRNPLQVRKAASALNYSKNAIKFAKDEVALQGKLVAALLEQLKSDIGL
ncbi:MAG: hypothetical protein LBV41_00985 [Cytophagaceae bacterium]|jgi:SMC interacting uncharacterized protein involved in chromosome segregation|nr:hypothetical protein [Cytophagaceae bacterium]